jgi:hypothetical protein
MRWLEPQDHVRGKRKGAHDSERDALLLAFFDENDPESPLSLGKKGELPKGGGKFYAPMTKTEFAKMLISDKRAQENWNANSVEQILRRIKYLRAGRTK